jgi:hypothetical protein
MAPGQQADEHAIHHVLLTDYYFADFLTHLVEMTGGYLE